MHRSTKQEFSTMQCTAILPPIFHMCESTAETFTDVRSDIGSITDYAVTKEVDLIVIDTRGRTGLKRFFMVSVANGVVQHAHCSVLLVG